MTREQLRKDAMAAIDELLAVRLLVSADRKSGSLKPQPPSAASPYLHGS